MADSLRSYLMSHPSGRCMRAGGAAASSIGTKRAAEKQAARQFEQLTGERAGKAITE